ncbi:MAG: fructosamine kinase family protein [gamma proteobacterium symbiont of Bathyaustriella thionipta]|nr:fructosamine kinase family protein [gamma proteobacterium symbiont of Bathyaustriella thionipta]
MTDWISICEQISAVTRQPLKPASVQPIAGGCINDCVLLQQDEQRYFVKTNRSSLLPMFAAEAAGLKEMASARAIRVPGPVCYGTAGAQSFLAMQYLPITAASGNERLAGQQLAGMHRKSATQFGWHRDNTIGSTPQHNDWQSDWPTFWRDQRLGFQLQLAAQKGFGGELQSAGKDLLLKLPAFFSDYQVQPSLLHGDLWGGNIGYLADGTAVIFDPACYYGDRETDIAMTQLFGGFSNDFYRGYESEWPLHAGFARRTDLYKLYHILNHLNLFGGAYLNQALSLMDRLLSL